MSCTNNNVPFVYNVTYEQPNCESCNDPDCNGYAFNAKCTYYTAAALPCTGIETNDSIEVALQKIEEKVCQNGGDYSTYDTCCLAPINTQQEFVEAISAGYCGLLSAFTDFTTITFVDYQTSVSNQFTAITSPAITCAAAGITPADNLATVYSKFCTAIGDLQEYTDISGVVWNNCFAVPTPPTNIPEAFDLINDQICSLVESGAALPLFNNVGSCLPTPGASDTLVDTVEKIKTRLCQTGTFDINALTWGCVTQPSVDETDLQAAMQTVITTLDDYIKNKLTFSADFNVAQTNVGDVCLGKTVSLVTPIVGNDRLVASNVADVTPGTLIDKLTGADANAVFDDTTPGVVTLTVLNDKVKANAADASADYLINKIDGQINATDGVSITESYNATTDKVDLTPNIDWATFAAKFMTEVAADPTLQAQFCALVAICNAEPTTTTTTTAEPGLFLYKADRYLCAGCTLDASNVYVQSTVGPLVTAKFYQGDDGNIYNIIALEAGVPTADINSATNYNTCGDWGGCV
jgi:hypothetical protein